MKKIGLLVLALVLALGGLGVGYAHWSQTLFVNTKVETGTVLIGFSEGTSNDPPPITQPGGDYKTGNIDPGHDKNVAACSVVLLNKKGTHGEDDIYETANITMINAYPSYSNNVTLTVANGGTIPVKLEELCFDWDIDGTADANVTTCQTYEVDLDSDNLTDFNLHVYPIVDNQIDPCETDNLTIELHLKQTATQNTTYGPFQIWLKFTQWNLVP